MGGKRATRGPDRAIAAIAARQHGVLSLTQLIDAGATPRAIDRRVRAGRLHRLPRRLRSGTARSRTAGAGSPPSSRAAKGPS